MAQSVVVFMEAGARWPSFIPPVGDVRSVCQDPDESNESFMSRVEQHSFDEETLETSEVFYVAYGAGSPGAAALRHATLSALVLRIDSERGGSIVLVAEGSPAECRGLESLTQSLNKELRALNRPESLLFRAQPIPYQAARPSLRLPKVGD